ncbi:hypothetical protein LEMLEM_LOCUS19020 [Lemmus lemmus]
MSLRVARSARGPWPAACAAPWLPARRGPGYRAPPPSALCALDPLCSRCVNSQRNTNG